MSRLRDAFVRFTAWLFTSDRSWTSPFDRVCHHALVFAALWRAYEREYGHAIFILILCGVTMGFSVLHADFGDDDDPEESEQQETPEVTRVGFVVGQTTLRRVSGEAK